MPWGIRNSWASKHLLSPFLRCRLVCNQPLYPQSAVTNYLVSLATQTVAVYTPDEWVKSHFRENNQGRSRSIPRHEINSLTTTAGWSVRVAPNHERKWHLCRTGDRGEMGKVIRLGCRQGNIQLYCTRVVGSVLVGRDTLGNFQTEPSVVSFRK